MVIITIANNKLCHYYYICYSKQMEMQHLKTKTSVA